MKRLIALLMSIFLLLGAVLPIYAQGIAEESALTEAEWEALLLTNRERIKNGCAPLTSTVFLQQVCDIRAAELTEVFSHDRPDGSICFSALEGIPFVQLGENIAAGYATPADVVNAWMLSKDHRDNILNALYAHAGVGHLKEGATDYWLEFFYTGDKCGYETMKLVGSNVVSADCKRIDEARLTLELKCGCGLSYLPLMDELCTGFTPGSSGKQTLTVECFGKKTNVEIVVEGGIVLPPDSFDDCPSDIFTDIVHDETYWYHNAIDWAVENRITNGTTETTFSPELGCTRGQAVTFLYRAAGSPPLQPMRNPFGDIKSTDYYYAAVLWAAGKHITEGTSFHTFSPEEKCTRGQIVTFLYRYQKAMAGDAKNPFADVKTSDYFYEPVLWAVEQGVTNGMSATTFGPNETCTRAQIVTFLYRACAEK